MEASIRLCREAARPLCGICWCLRFGEGVTRSSAVSCCTRWQILVALWPRWSLLFPRSSLSWLFCLFSLIYFYLTVKSISFDWKGHSDSADVWVRFGRLDEPSVTVTPCPTWVLPAVPHLSVPPPPATPTRQAATQRHKPAAAREPKTAQKGRWLQKSAPSA